MALGMLDATTLAGLGNLKSAPSTKEATLGDEFKEVYERTLAPPGTAPPEREIAGPEESPTNAPNARSSQMDPQPKATEVEVTLVELAIGSISVEELPVSLGLVNSDGTADVIMAGDPDGPANLDLQRDLVGSAGIALQGDPLGSASLTLQGDSVASAGLALQGLEGNESEEGFADGAPSDEGAAEPRTFSGRAPESSLSGRAENGLPKGERLEAAPNARPVNHLDHIEVLAAKNTRVKIELNPLDLGPMTVQVSQEGKEIKTHVVVENPALRLALERQQGHLTAALSEAGMNLAQFSMERGAPQEDGPAGFLPQPEKLLHKQRTTYASTTGGLEIWA